MLKRYTFWLWMAAVLMLITGAVHSIGLFITPTPQNDIERQLLELMNSFKIDAGAGFHPSWANLFTALSSCFTLLCFLGGLTNAYLLKKKAGQEILRGVVLIDAVIFGACFLMMAFFTFLPPIILTGLIFVSLLLALILMPKQRTISD
jgi:hypothetical protein